MSTYAAAEHLSQNCAIEPKKWLSSMCSFKPAVSIHMAQQLDLVATVDTSGHVYNVSGSSLAVDSGPTV